MIEIDTRIRNAVAAAFAARSLANALVETARAGPIGLRLEFGSQSLASTYVRSFAVRSVDTIDLSLRVITPEELDLSHMIPHPPEAGRTYVGDDCFALWFADRLPILYILDRASRRGVVWLAKGASPDWELSRPACPLIHAALFDGPWTAIHGGAVGRNGRVVLLAGKGHAGKTTAAVACARAGWDYAGDDYVLANVDTGQVEPIYASARLRADMAGDFSDLLESTRHSVSSDSGDVKHELALSGTIPSERLKGGKLAVILLPRRRGAALPEFVEASRGDAFQALFVSTSLGAPAPLKVTAERLSALVALAPTYFVDTGNDPLAIPPAFEEFAARF